jgi:murein DD-endopeptidase MepM/ murein hydrolase activator NlpD
MKCWPVPDSYVKSLPEKGSSGTFWEDRGDRHHCGIDIYAPKGSSVVAVEDGEIIDIGMFTSPDMIPYWNITYYILIMNYSGLICKYAELDNTLLNVSDSVKSCQTIAQVGSVLNPDKITNESPKYIQRLIKNNNQSMLHFELYNGRPKEPHDYIGGNVFSDVKPNHLADPIDYLKSTVKCH